MLLKEYALEPEVLGTRTNWQILLPQIGASQGRLIARFPKDWKKRVYNAAKNTAKPTELSWIEERLRRINDSTLFARGRSGGDTSRPWLENTLAEHQRNPFAAIIGSTPSDDVLLVDDLDEADPWSCQRQCEVHRNARAMADAISLLFLSGTRFKLIDPHLDPSKRRFQRPLAEFLGRIATRATGENKVHVECHVRTDGRSEEESRFAQNFQKAMTPIIPSSLTVSLHYHPSAKMHDRFVLSPWGGVDFGQGLDEGDEPPKVKVTLMEEHLRQAKWDEYSSAQPALVLPKAG